MSHITCETSLSLSLFLSLSDSLSLSTEAHIRLVTDHQSQTPQSRHTYE